MKKRRQIRDVNHPDYWLHKEPPPGEPCVTPGTNITFSGLAEWVEGYYQLKGRADSADKYAAIADHIAALPLSYIKKCGDYRVLLDALFCIEQEVPPRGQRDKSPTTRLKIEIHNVLHRRSTQHEKRRRSQSATAYRDA